jgi:hypothetical protein
MDDVTRKQPASDRSGGAPAAEVRIRAAHLRKRSLARENPQAYPEVSADQLLKDLENPELDDE